MVLKSQRRQIKDLTGFPHISKRQATLLCLALVCWYAMNNDLVGLCGLAQGAARVTFFSPVGLWPATRKDLGAGFFKPSLDGGLLELRLLMFSRDCICRTASCNTVICRCNIKISASFSAWLNWFRLDGFALL